VHTGFWWGNLKERLNSEDIDSRWEDTSKTDLQRNRIRGYGLD
jgi:hypothetical protein